MLNKGEKLLVLGASPYQVPLIRAARRIGYTVYAASYLPDDPGLAVADKGCPISILDVDRLVDLCRQEQIGAVTTAASDLATLSVGQINDALGLEGLRESQVRSVTDKGNFVRLLDELDLPRPRSVVVRSRNDMEAALAEWASFPAVLKPLFSSGTRGVRIVDSVGQVRTFHEQCLSASQLDKGYVLQAFLEGVEHGCECLIEHGRVVFLQLTHKFLSDRNVPLGHCVPYQCPAGVLEHLTAQVDRIVDRLGVRCSAANIDVIISPEHEPYIIDFSFRLGGNLLPDLMSQRFGVDMYARVAEHCRSDGFQSNMAVRESSNSFGSVIFGLAGGGTLTRELREGLTRWFESQGGLIELIFDLKDGDRIEPFEQSSRRFGHALFRVDDVQTYCRLLHGEQTIVKDVCRDE